jgi:SAM-dependent methyltransferase
MVAVDGGYCPGQRVLDVGSGIGGPALTISRQTGIGVVGVDLLRTHVETARSRAQNAGLDGRVAFVQADGQRLPFAGGSFDHVYLFESGCHMLDKAMLYRECGRVLRSGGSFGGTDWMRRDGPLDGHERARLLRVCAGFQCPELLSLAELRAHLAGAGLVPAFVEDLTASGDLSPNWEPLARSFRGRRLQGPGQARAADMLTRAGAELAAAAAEGTFIVGRWLAWKL